MTISKPAGSLPAPDSGARRQVLAEIPAGGTAEIIGLTPNTPAEVQTRLTHLGFAPGTRVTKLRDAPLGDPGLYRLLGSDTCLRRREASYIEVTRGQE